MKDITTITDNDSSLTIHYNDKKVQIDPKQQLNIKWTNGKNGFKSTESKKAKYANLDLPSVSFRHVERLPKATMARPFKMPSAYVQCATEEEEDNEGVTEYDLDREDLAWLQLANARRQKIGVPPIDDDTLEKAIDMLEKESHFQFTQDENGSGLAYLTMIDNDAPCCICNDGEDSNANQIIFCDICNIAVHQECYGVPYIPEGQWLCRRCQMSPSIPVNCALCPCSSGAFKQTSDGRWAHVVCAIWLNEVHFANTVFLEPVEGVDFSIKRRHKLTCLICKRKVGACLQCSNKACVRSFHATCARYAGMKMVVKESRARNNPDSVTINRFAYCFQHSEPNRNGQSVAVWKREMEAKLKEARKMIDLNAKQTLNSVPLPVIPVEKVQTIAQRLGLNYMNDIYSFWSLKRKSRSGVPLIRRLQVYMNQQKPMLGRPFGDESAVPIVGTADNELAVKVSSPVASDTVGTMAMAQNPAATMDDDPLKRFAELRRNFERIRLLCELIKKREKMKRDQLTTNWEIVCKTTRPLTVLVSQTLDKLIDKDHQKLFTEPHVPGYSTSIAQPMNFHQLRANHEKGRYRRIADLRADFLLMIQNWIVYNKSNTQFYNYGQRIKRIGLSAIKAAEEEEQRMNEFSNTKTRDIELLTTTLPPMISEAAFRNLHNEFKLLHNNEETADGIGCEKTVPENGTATTTPKCSLVGEQVQQQHTTSNNNTKLRKYDRAASSSSAVVPAAGGRVASFSGKKNAVAKKKFVAQSSDSVARSGSSSNTAANNNNILSEQQEKKADDNDNSSSSSRLKRTHSKASSAGGATIGDKTPRTVGKGWTTKNKKTTTTTTTTTTLNRNNTVVQPTNELEKNGHKDEDHKDEPPHQTATKTTTATTLKKRRRGDLTTAVHGHQPQMPHGGAGKSSGGARRNNANGGGGGAGKKGISQRRLTIPLLSSQPSTAPVAVVTCNKNVVRKRYLNAYQTEASSTAESDSGQCDDELLFTTTSMPEQNEDDADELPLGLNGKHATPTKAATTTKQTPPTTPRRRYIRAGQKKKFLHVDDNFVPQSPTSSLRHNDIVMVQDSKFPGRVIDIRMRAIDLEDEDDDDVDGDCISGGRRSNNSAQSVGNNINNTDRVGRHFIDHALRTKPTQDEMGRQQHTLILFFDTQNTCKWVPNDRIRLLYDYDLNNKTLRTEKDQTVVEAFERAKRFWKSFIHC
ncbi:hypothetical protein niasHS_001747 [Heterodera schachtii]|uniref:Peregrin n=1 Tax=Heterodera schachtii TaxID=97005 RepID=A0ABD2KCG1_HETSC